MFKYGDTFLSPISSQCCQSCLSGYQSILLALRIPMTLPWWIQKNDRYLRAQQLREINGLVLEKSQMAQMLLQCAQMQILKTSPKFSWLKTLQLLFILCRESVYKLCYYLGDFRPLLCIHPGDIYPESVCFFYWTWNSYFHRSFIFIYS